MRSRSSTGRATELAHRIIPCLDVADGQVVKGVRFTDFTGHGDPAEAAKRYADQGADEIVFLDIGAAPEARPTRVDWVERTASQVFVPLTVGGGIRTPSDADLLFRSGADKVAVNTAAVADPELLGALAGRWGSQSVVLSVDARRRPEGGWEVVTQGGRRATGREAVEWMREGVARGAGEILLTSIDGDGTLGGYDLELVRAATGAVEVPIVASGGAGRLEHLEAALGAGASAVLAASLFHRRWATVREIKTYLRWRGFEVRL